MMGDGCPARPDDDDGHESALLLAVVRAHQLPQPRRLLLRRLAAHRRGLRARGFVPRSRLVTAGVTSIEA